MSRSPIEPSPTPAPAHPAKPPPPEGAGGAAASREGGGGGTGGSAGPIAAGTPLPDLRAALLRFFDGAARSLPWREIADPYAILVSEVMLQQTRVETVVPFYRGWMARFPTVEVLARAEEEAVLLAWKGLGYYRRARNLHGAARTVVEAHAGRIPSTLHELRALPGVGAYTAGAVASMAFGVPVPAVDGNVRRVFARLLDDPAPSPATLERTVGAQVDPERPGDFNQALMEVGSTLCTPRSPRCGRCPLAPWCGSRVTGTQEERPTPARSRPVPRFVEAVSLLTWWGGPEARREESGPLLLVEPRPREGLLGGMWQAPSRQVGGAGDRPTLSAILAVARDGVREALSREEAERQREGNPVLLEAGHRPALDHLFTHRKVHYAPVAFELRGGTAPPDPGVGPGGARRWIRPGELDALPLPRAQERILQGWRAEIDAAPEGGGAGSTPGP